MDALAYNIKIVRGISKLNQTDFGKYMKVTRAMQRSYEAGQAKPDALYMQRLSRLTRVKEEDLRNKKLQEKDMMHVEFEQNEQEKKAAFEETNNDNDDVVEILKNHNSFLQRLLESNLNKMSEVQYMILAQVQAGQKWSAKKIAKGNEKQYLKEIAEVSTLAGESLNAFGVMDIAVPVSKESKSAP